MDEDNMRKVAFISVSDPFVDKVAWSGTIFKLREAVENAGFKVEWLPCSVSEKAVKWLKRIYRRLPGAGDEIRYDQMASYFRLMAQSVDSRRLNSSGFEFVFLPSDSQMAPYLKTALPIVSYGDCTFDLMTEYYWYNLPALVKWMGNRNERKGFKRCSLILKSSFWATSSVINTYGIDPLKVKTLELGANIDIPVGATHIGFTESSGPLNLFFSGVDWVRKGGQIAVDTIRILRDRGLDAHLYVAGIKKLPDEVKDLSFIHYVGFLNKNNADDYERYLSLYRNCQLLLLPTKAECAGVVFCEAAAFGLPSYTYDTGGIPNYVIDGVNGRRLPLGCSAELFADAIINDLNSGMLEVYSGSSQKLYNEKLSWSAWSRRFAEILNER